MLRMIHTLQETPPARARSVVRSFIQSLSPFYLPLTHFNSPSSATAAAAFAAAAFAAEDPTPFAFSAPECEAEKL